MNSFQAGIVISLGCYLAIGWYAGKRVKHLEDFFVAGRNAPTVLILGTLVASFMSTNAFMGEAGMSYQGHAPAGHHYDLLQLPGLYRRRGVLWSVPQAKPGTDGPRFFRSRFKSRRIQVFAGVSIVAGLSAYLLAVTWGMALIITEVTGFSEVVAILMVWASYTLFTLYSGSRGVILTDTVMFLLFSSIIVVTAFFIVQAAGGWSSVIDSLATYADKPGIIAWHGRVGPDVYWQTPMEGLLWASILGVAWGIVVAVSPWQTSRYLMARSEHVVIRSACGALIAMLLLYLVTNFAAATVNLINPDISPPESTMIWVSMNLLPTVLGAILICGVLAAGLSSASTFLSLVGFSVSHDILGSAEETAEKSVESGAGEDQLSQLRGGRLRSARVAMLCVGVTVIVLALMLPRNIYWLTHFAGPLFASSWGVVAFMSIWSRRITESGAFWGMAVGFAVNVGMNALSLAGFVKWPVMADPILVGVICSYIAVAIVSRRGTVTAMESAYQEALHRMPNAERDPETVRQTLLWPKVMVVMGALISVLMTLFYALPYQEAVAGVLHTLVENAL